MFRRLCLVLPLLAAALGPLLAPCEPSAASAPDTRVPGAKDLDKRLALLQEKKPTEPPPTPPRFPFDADAAGRYQRAYADWLGLPLEWRSDEGLTFVLVPPGTFLMGSPDDEPGHAAGG